MTVPQQHKQVVVFDMPRTRSHLFSRYITTHPDLEHCAHPFVAAACFGPERLGLRMTFGAEDDPTAKSMVPVSDDDTYEGAAAAFLGIQSEAIRNGKILTSSEHVICIAKPDIAIAYAKQQDLPKVSNPTILSDENFRDAIPLFVIRHPVASVPSIYKLLMATTLVRPGSEAWRWMNGTGLQRYFVDIIKERDGKAPLIIDGDDVVWRTEEVGKAVSAAIGIDEKLLSTTWQPTPEKLAEYSEFRKYTTKVIHESSGINKPAGPRPDYDLDKAVAEWKESYGEVVAEQLKQTVEEVMPHYEYMKQLAI